MTDNVSVVRAIKKAVTIAAAIELIDITTASVIKEKILSEFNKQLKITEKLTYSQVIKNLHIDGVHKVLLTSLAKDSDIACGNGEIIAIKAVELTFKEALNG